MLQKIKDFLFKNTSAKQTVAKNTFWLSVSNFGGRLIKAVIIIYAARVLGTDGYGVFSYVITLAGFLTLFMDPGINGILIRDAAKVDDKERRAVFGTMFVIKLVLLVIGVGVIIFVAPLFTTLPGAKVLIPIVALVLAFDTLREFFFSLIRATENMQWEAAIFLLANVGIVVFGFIFLAYAATAQSFSWGYVAGDALGTIAAMIALRSYFKKIFSQYDPARVMPILRAAWPFAISGALGLLFTNSDILIISWMRSASDVGIYSAAIRIIQTLYLVPGIIQYATLPIISRLAKNDSARFRTALERTLGMVFLMSIPLSLGGIVLGTQIMGFIFGPSYAAGGLAFKILAATLMFDFPAAIIINALFAYEHQKSLVISSALGGVVNVGLDLTLIPFFGITGSAVATLIAQAINNGYLWWAMKKVNPFTVLSSLKRIFIGGIVMAACAIGLMALGTNVALNIILCTIVYFGALRVMREPLLIEIKRIIFPPAVPVGA
ncbi:MAG TPA: flippase [Candidatus Paceibacterota bacterium]|nr:flippase [Candidatus Paceibacterota bacterium]